MHKFLMIDDEEVVRQGFRERIPWEALGFEFLEPCGDGLEGLRAVALHHPDVVMTDIRMPQMDGLEFCRLMARDHPEVRVVVLSGHDEFRYAREALRSKVVDYLLKPLSSGELKTFLLGLKSELDRPPVLGEDEGMRKLMAGTLPHDRRLPLEAPWSDEWPGAGWCAGQLLLFPHQARAEGSLLASIDEILGRRTHPWSGLAEPLVIQGGAAARVHLLFPGTDPARASLRAFRDTLALTQEFRRAGFRVAGSLGNPRTHHLQASESLREAGENLILRFLRPEAFTGGLLSRSGSAGKADTLMPLVHRLSSLLREGERAAVDPFLGQLAQALEGLTCHPVQVHREIRNLYGVLPTDAQEDTPLDLRLDTLADGPQWLADLRDRMMRALDQASAPGIPLAERVLARFEETVAEAYIDPDLGIEGISRRLQVSPSYLSKLLRRRGTNFVRFLLEHRISRAKELLFTTNLTTSEVAERVGFHEYRYFSTQFKRQTGTTPTGWRTGTGAAV